jgi:hypothetical protein
MGIRIEIMSLNIVTCTATASQRLGKHIPAKRMQAINKTSTTRQRNSKHASLQKQAVFCVVRTDGL